MGQVMRLFLLAALALAASGCAPDLSALAADKNAVCATETSVWVTVKLDRNWGCEFPPPGFVLVPITAAH